MNKAEQIERAIEVLGLQVKALSDELDTLEFEEDIEAYKFDISIKTLAIEALEQALEREKNEPLTLEQLKDMVGEPIFVAYGGNMDYDELYEWKLIDAVNEQGIVFTDYTSFDLDDCKYIGFYKYKKERD